MTVDKNVGFRIMLYVKADDETIAMTDKREIIGIAYHTGAGAQTAITYGRAQINDRGISRVHFDQSIRLL